MLRILRCNVDKITRSHSDDECEAEHPFRTFVDRKMALVWLVGGNLLQYDVSQHDTHSYKKNTSFQIILLSISQDFSSEDTHVFCRRGTTVILSKCNIDTVIFFESTGRTDFFLVDAHSPVPLYLATPLLLIKGIFFAEIFCRKTNFFLTPFVERLAGIPQPHCKSKTSRQAAQTTNLHIHNMKLKLQQQQNNSAFNSWL